MPILDSGTSTSTSTQLQGTVSAVQQVNLAPRTEGVLSQYMVEVGSPVLKDDTVAALDPGTILGQLADASASVISAQAQLVQIQQGARPEDIAAGQAQVDAAQATLHGLTSRLRVWWGRCWRTSGRT
jgi:HlyD family secretion protein